MSVDRTNEETQTSRQVEVSAPPTDLIIDLTADSGVYLELASRFPDGTQRIELAEIRELGPWATLRRLRRRAFMRAVVLVNEHRKPARWLSMALLGLLPRASQRTIMDRAGHERPLSWLTFVVRELPFILRRARLSRRVCRQASRQSALLGRATAPRPVSPQHVLFVRADLGPALAAGGSLAHIRGVIDGFESHDRQVKLLSPAAVAGQPEDRLEILPPDDRFDLSVELPHLAYNDRLLTRCRERIRADGIDLVYLRHALGSYAGALAAQELGVPLVVEFNGSEVWIARNWGAARHQLGLLESIEARTLAAADLVVAVSEPLVAQLVEAGVPRERILVNPNGVDADRFDPATLESRRRAIREQLGAGPDECVAGFVGTFGPWHGAELLARAISRLSDGLVARTRFVFVGDGPRRPHTREILRESDRLDRAHFTGMVDFDETPGFLAACDLCISPHVPNTDRTPFFGSPTKLFEYMASGRAIVASRLGQIGDVLQHERNAWLVTPGDVDELVSGIERLASDDELRRRLGETARADAVGRHSWSVHVERILERLANPSAGVGDPAS